MTTFLTNLDLGRNQLLNAVVQNLAVAPADPKAGQVYFDTADNQLKVYAGEAWKALGALDQEGAVRLLRDNGMTLATALSDQGYDLSVLTGIDDRLNNKADEVKRYADQIKADLLGSAGEDYDTFKEIEDLLKRQAENVNTIQNVAKKYSTTIGDGVALEHTVSHNLGSRDVAVTLRLTNSPYEQVLADVLFTDDNTLTVRTAQALTVDQLTVTVVG